MQEERSQPTLNLSDQQLLNPLIFPAETDGRFRMFVAGTVMLALYTIVLFIVLIVVATSGSIVGGSVLMADIPWSLRSTTHIEEAIGDRWIFDLGDDEVRALSRNLQITYGNALISGMPRLIALTLFVLVLLGTALALYYAHPWSIRRKQHLRPLTAFGNPDFAEDVRASVAAIAAEVDITPPTVEIMTHEYDDAQIFGLRNRYVLRLTAQAHGRVDELKDIWRRRKQPAFRARVLHELGHIANGDIGRSYFATTLWRAFIAIVIAPLALVSIGFPSWLGLDFLPIDRTGQVNLSMMPTNLGGRLIVLGFQITALILIARANHRGLLRIREFYADWRAMLWGAGATLVELLERPALPAPPRARSDKWMRLLNSLPGRIQSIISRLAGWWARWTVYVWERIPRSIQSIIRRLAGWWVRLWQFHTSRHARLARLADPALLFTISPDLPFLTGVLLAFMMIGLPFLFILGLPVLYADELASWSLVRIVIEWPAPLNRIFYSLILLIARFAIQISLLLGLLFLVAYLVVGTLGRQVQRAAIVDLLPSRQGIWGYFGLWKTAFLLAVGVELGFWIMPASVYTIRDVYSLILVPIWLVVFMLLTWFWLIYVRVLTRCLIGAHKGRNLPRIKGWLVTGCSIISLWALYLPMLLTRGMIAIVPGFLQPPPGSIPSGLNITDIRFMFGFSLFVMFSLGLLIFIGWSVFSLGLALLWQRLRRRACPTCGQAVHDPIMVGRTCPACYNPLAAWLYINLRRKA